LSLGKQENVFILLLYKDNIKFKKKMTGKSKAVIVDIGFTVA
jgi:hypothetical protein